MTTLSELIEGHQKIMDLIASQEGEITDDLGSELMVNGLSMADKVDSYAYVMKLLEHAAEGEREEARKRTERARQLENRLESMKARVKEPMVHYDVSELMGHKTKFQTTKMNYKVTPIKDLKDIPREFHREKIEITLDKEKALNALLSADNPDLLRYFRLEQSPTLMMKLNTLRRIDERSKNTNKDGSLHTGGSPLPCAEKD